MSIVPLFKSENNMKPLVIKLEFYASGVNQALLSPTIFVPAGYSIPRVGEVVVLPSETGSQARICEGVIHQFNGMGDSQVSGEDCTVAVIRLVVSEPQKP